MFLRPRTRKAVRTIKQALEAEPNRQWSSEQLAELVGLPVNFVAGIIVSDLLYRGFAREGDPMKYKLNPPRKKV